MRARPSPRTRTALCVCSARDPIAAGLLVRQFAASVPCQGALVAQTDVQHYLWSLRDESGPIGAAGRRMLPCARARHTQRDMCLSVAILAAGLVPLPFRGLGPFGGTGRPGARWCGSRWWRMLLPRSQLFLQACMQATLIALERLGSWPNCRRCCSATCLRHWTPQPSRCTPRHVLCVDDFFATPSVLLTLGHFTFEAGQELVAVVRDMLRAAWLHDALPAGGSSAVVSSGMWVSPSASSFTANSLCGDVQKDAPPLEFFEVDGVAGVHRHATMVSTAVRVFADDETTASSALPLSLGALCARVRALAGHSRCATISPNCSARQSACLGRGFAGRHGGGGGEFASNCVG